MSKYLTKVTEVYRITTEGEVEAFLKKLKMDSRFDVAKYTSTKKQTKVKGEVVDEWVHFEVTKLFNEEKNPDSDVTIDYKISSAWDGPVVLDNEEDEDE